MQRRDFLKQMGIGGIVGLNFLYPGVTKVLGVDTQVANASTDNTLSSEPYFDPDFAGGRLVKYTPEGLILESGDNLRAVRLHPEANIWKEFDFKASEFTFQLGNYIDARGKALKDGTVLANRVWVNIGRADGKVDVVLPDGLQFLDRNGQKRVMELSSKLEVITAKDDRPLPGHISGLRSGQHIGAVGLMLPNGGFRATRVWLWEEQG